MAGKRRRKSMIEPWQLEHLNKFTIVVCNIIAFNKKKSRKIQSDKISILKFQFFLETRLTEVELYNKCNNMRQITEIFFREKHQRVAN